LYKASLGEEAKNQDLEGRTEAGALEPVLSQNLAMKVGGIAGIGATTANAVIKIDKLNYTAGESINTYITMNNKDCAKPVKSFKYKLRRNIQAFMNRKKNPAPVLSREEYLFEIKEEGCEAKTEVEKEFVLEIPEADKKFGKLETLHPDLRQLVKIFSDTTNSTLFAINYYLDIFIKHKSKTEFGMGNFVSFPISIHTGETNLPMMDQRCTAWEQIN